MTTLKQAYAVALDRVSGLMPFGNQYQVNTYDTDRQAWWQGYPKDFFSARASRSRSLIEVAMIELDVRLEDAIWLASRYDGGSWREYVAKHHKENC